MLKAKRSKKNSQQIDLTKFVSEYKGNKILDFDPGNNFSVKLGIRKVQAVLENLELATKFVEEYKKK